MATTPRRGAMLALLALSVSACWPQAGAGPGRTGSVNSGGSLSSATVDELEQIWSTSAGSGPAREPLVVGNNVYARTDGAVTALDLDTGDALWTVALAGTGMPAVADGELHVPTDGRVCQLTSLSLGSGTVVDQQPAGYTHYTAPGAHSSCTFGDSVAVGDTVFAPWHFVGMGPDLVCHPEGSFAEGPGLAAVDVTAGSTLWQHFGANSGCGYATSPPPPAYGDPSWDGERVLTWSGSKLRARPPTCEAGTGCPWSLDHNLGGTVVGPAVALPDGQMAVATASGRVLVLDAASLTIDWWGSVGATVSQPLAATSSRLYATGDDGRVVAFDLGCRADTCEPDWTTTLDSPASARPSIVGNVLFVGSADGTVSALPTGGCDGCAPLWTGTVPDEVTGPPAIAFSTVFVGSADGSVTAFGLSDG